MELVLEVAVGGAGEFFGADAYFFAEEGDEVVVVVEAALFSDFDDADVGEEEFFGFVDAQCADVGGEAVGVDFLGDGVEGGFADAEDFADFVGGEVVA